MKTVKVHEGRLRKLLQFLRDEEAVIRVDYDEFENSKTTTYSSGDEGEHSLKELILNIWTDTTDWAYYEYQKNDYEVIRRTTAKKKHHPSYEKFIRDITCTFKENAKIDNLEEKEQLFFSGDRVQMTNVLAVFPTQLQARDHYRDQTISKLIGEP